MYIFKLVILNLALFILHMIRKLQYLSNLLYNLVLTLLHNQDRIVKTEDLKIPKHIVLSFTNELKDLNLVSISRIVNWCEQLRIQQVTLYDECGKLKDVRKQLLSCMKSISPIKGKEANLDNVQILSKQDGRQLFVEHAQKIVQNDPESIDASLIDSHLGWSNDPDLLVIFGEPTCIYSFPPWHLRLTEIITLPSHISIPQETFMTCLKQFSKIEQRIGT